MTDYIKREDAIEALGEEPYVWSDTDAEIAEHAQWVSDVKAIEAVPSTDVQPVVHGKWDKNSDMAFYWKCSECGAYLFWRYEDFMVNGKPNFCPNCGAQMESEEKDDK